MLEYLQMMMADGGTEAITGNVSGKDYRGVLVLGSSGAEFGLTGQTGWASITADTFPQGQYIPGRFSAVTDWASGANVLGILAP